MTTLKELIRTKEFAELAGLTHRSFQQYDYLGMIPEPHVRIGIVKLWRRTDAAKWIKENPRQRKRSAAYGA